MDLPVTTPTSMLLNPSILHIELTSRCVLKCPRCPRTELDLDYLNQEISINEFQRIFPVEALTLVKRMIFCGHTGDPIYANSLIPVVEYVKTNSNAEIIIITNGSYRKTEFWQELGGLLTKNDMVVFSVDGWDQSSNSLYRVNCDFESITNGIQTLRQSSGCKIKWSTIYFRFNQDQIAKIKKLARQLGCDFFECVRSSKFDGSYSVNGVDDLKPMDDRIASTLLYERDITMLTKTTLPVPIINAKQEHQWARCANHLKDIFLDVRGLILPCPWFTGDYQQNAFLDQYRDRLSVHRRNFLDILNDQDLWNALRRSWDEDPVPICQLKCKNG